MERATKEPPPMEPSHKRKRGSSKSPSPRGDAPRQACSTATDPKCQSREPPPAPPPAGSPTKIPQKPSPTPVRQTPPLHRVWESFSHFYGQPPLQGRPFDFSLMSYNILSQDLLHDNSYLYAHCPAAVLGWGFRLPNLLRELQRHNADILCLQEVQQNHYEEQIRPALEAQGYQCEYKRRTGRKPDGCCVAFRTERFSLVSSHPVEYVRPGVPVLDRDNVALLLLLRPTAKDPGTLGSAPDAVVCVANTHLLYNPRRGDIKLAQLAVLLAEIGRVARRHDGTSCPVMLCGDLNSVPWSPLYAFLRSGRLDYQGITTARVSGQEENARSQRLLDTPIWPPSVGINWQCQYPPHTPTCTDVGDSISGLSIQDQAAQALQENHCPRIEHGVRLHSAYSHFCGDGRPEVTTCHSRTAITVDYILYTPAPGDIAAHREYSRAPPLPDGRGLMLLGRLGLVGLSELMKVNGLPNEHHSSDHLPILARFRLCP